MRKISLCFLWVFWLSVVGAAEKDCLPTGESAANFLIRQVGGGYAELTTDSQQKKPLQLLMEEIVLADGRQKAPGKWIDDIPDTLPSALPDMEPRMTSATLFTDAAGANAHWDAFIERCSRKDGKAGTSLLTSEQHAVLEAVILQRKGPDDMDRMSETWRDAIVEGCDVMYVEYLRGEGATRLRC